MSNQALKYSKLVEKHILKCVRGGVSLRETLASMQHLQDAPKSMTTLYKHYGDLLYAERARINGEVGSRVIDQAINGDPDAPNTWKAREFFLRSKGGWTPKETVETREVGSDSEEEESAVNALMKALGKATDEE